ncbi:RES family NAD+ phosphorylase [Yaniella flava]|uniref:RES family NAD+ phosphorylase n=1 Tax=Yaniella flava TaxID=287930 RepID=UPI0031D505C2
MIKERKCCAACFGDPGLENIFFTEQSLEVGECGYCRETDVRLQVPSALQDEFEQLLEIYNVEPTYGESLPTLFKKDWKLFANERLNFDAVQVLLGDIFDDGERARRIYKPEPLSDNSALDILHDFRQRITFENRWFLEDSDSDYRPVFHRIEEFHDLLRLDLKTPQKSWYRARKTPGNTAHPLSEMGAPPANLTSSGRVNPAGIPYLYLSSSVQTALAEIRPRPAENVTLATFADIDRVVAALYDPRYSITPFGHEDSRLVRKLRDLLPILEYMSNQLSRPVAPDDADFEYVPTQYFCEFLKSLRYDGVRFRSAISEGENLALFNHHGIHPESVQLHQITNIEVSARITNVAD